MTIDYLGTGGRWVSANKCPDFLGLVIPDSSKAGHRTRFTRFPLRPRRRSTQTLLQWYWVSLGGLTQ